MSADAREYARRCQVLDLIANTAREHHCDIELVYSTTRTPHVVRARRAIVAELVSLGLSESAAARCLGRDRSTIRNLRNARKRG